jgi:hypothetical protein
VDLAASASHSAQEPTSEGVELVFFYGSELAQLIYSWRSKSVEPLFERIRTCSASTLSRREEGHEAKMFVLLSVRYQAIVYHNHLTGSQPMALKHMLGSRDILGNNYAQAKSIT